MTNTTWNHARALRLSHPKGLDKAVGEYILHGNVVEGAPAIIVGKERMKNAASLDEVLAVLGEHTDLPWEAVPTQYLNEVKVWKTLFENGQLNGQALVRNITRLARAGAFKDMQFAAAYAARLTDETMIARTRLHPLAFLIALRVHQNGQKNRDQSYWGGYYTKDWETSSVIANALEQGFYAAFKYVEPAGKATLISIDVSGSMSSPASNLDMSCAEVAAAMAMVIARTEPAHQVMGFATSYRDLGVTANDSLESALRKTSNMNFGGTDASVPPTWALKNRVEVDTFVTITDNDTWAGRNKPTQALNQYRQQMNRPQARSIVVALNSNEFSIADPTDPLQLDVVGGDANLPRIITEFSAGRI